MIKIPLQGPSIRGFVKRIEAVHAKTGKRRVLLAEGCPNQILLTGMEPLADRADWMNFCQVGTSEVAPDPAQSSLQGWVAGTGTQHGTSVTGAQATAPFYGWKQKIFRFPDDAIVSNQNLNEVGVGWHAGGPGNEDTLLSRALIVDINGDHITPQWKVGEYLDVTYELRYYPPLVDVTGNVQIAGLGYDYILRALAVTSTGPWGGHIGEAIGQYSLNSGDWNVYDGPIGSIEDSVPGGLTANCDNSDQYNVAVGLPNYTVGVAVQCGATGWLLANGIRCIRIRTTAGDYQIQFLRTGTDGSDPSHLIPKTVGQTMAAQFNITWAAGNPL